MKKSRIIMILIVVLVVVVVIVGMGMMVRTKLKGNAKSTIVRVENAQRGELIEFVSAPGEIEPKTKVEISARVSARIVELPYEEGDHITCGDPNANPPVPASVLVRLDARDLESMLVSAEAYRESKAAAIETEKSRISEKESELEALHVILQKLERDLERQKKLFETKDISKATYDEAASAVAEKRSNCVAAKHKLETTKLNVVKLQHELESAEAEITMAREMLNDTIIVSPIDGVITQLNADVGEMVVTGTMNNPGTVILEVADLSTMLLVAQVDEADVGKMAVGQKATVHVRAFPDEEFEGVVDSIALKHRLSMTGTKYFRTEILLHGDVKRLYSGLTAHVDIETVKHKNVLNVSSPAVLGRPIDDLPLNIRENSAEVDLSKTYATVVYRYLDGKAVVTPVKIGQSNLTHTIIESGITEEDKIVVGPYKVLEGIQHDQVIQDEREAIKKKGNESEAEKDTPGDVNDVKDANDANQT